MTRILRLAAASAVLCITTACSLWPAQPPTPQVHDLGPLPALKDKAPAPSVMVSVTTSAWLANDAVHYRFLYDDPTALRSYADQRWAAPPAELLAARLRYRLAFNLASDNAGAHSSYVLSAVLLEFEQDFTTVHDAQAQLQLEISLRRSSDNQLIAQRRFVMSQATPPDVQGAISSLAQLANRTSVAIVQWAQIQMGGKVP